MFVFVGARTSNPYSKIGIHLCRINCRITSSEAIKNAAHSSVEGAFGVIQQTPEVGRANNKNPKISYVIYPWNFTSISNIYIGTLSVIYWSYAQATFGKEIERRLLFAVYFCHTLTANGHCIRRYVI